MDIIANFGLERVEYIHYRIDYRGSTARIVMECWVNTLYYQETLLEVKLNASDSCEYKRLKTLHQITEELKKETEECAKLDKNIAFYPAIRAQILWMEKTGEEVERPIHRP